MRHFLFGFIPESPSAVEMECWRAAAECAADFDIITERTTPANPGPFGPCLDGLINTGATEILLTMMAFFGDRGFEKQLASSLESIRDQINKYFRLSLHPLLIAVGEESRVLETLDKLKDPIKRVYIFSPSFLDGSPTGDAVPVLIEYFLKSLFSIGSRQSSEVIRADEFCAVGCKTLEYPLPRLARKALAGSFERFRKAQLEASSPTFDLHLDLDFTVPKAPETPAITDLYRGRSVDDLLDFAEDGFDADAYIAQKTQTSVMSLRNRSFGPYIDSCREVWNVKSQINLKTLHFERIGNFLRDTGGLNSVKSALLAESDRMSKKMAEIAKVSDLTSFWSYIPEYVKNAKSDFLSLIEKLKAYRRAKALGPTIRLFGISFVVMLALSASSLILFGPTWRLSTKLLVSIASSLFSASVISGLVRFFKLILTRRAAEKRLDECAERDRARLKKIWDSWIFPQKKSLENRMAAKSISYYIFLIVAFIKKIDAYADELRKHNDFLTEEANANRVRDVLPMDEGLEGTIIDSLREGFEPDWSRSYFRNFEAELKENDILGNLNSILASTIQDYMKAARKSSGALFNSADLAAVKELLSKQPLKNIPVQRHGDFAPESSLELICAPMGMEGRVREIFPGAEVLPWRYPEALSGILYWLNIGASETTERS